MPTHASRQIILVILGGGRALRPLVLAMCIGAFSAWPAGAQTPLFESEPYDLITLDKYNDNKVLKVEPLDLPGRRVPEKQPPRGRLEIRLVDEPESLYDVQWHMIEKIELFEELVLAEANRLVTAGELEEAYDCFRFLEERYPETRGLDSAMEEYLYEEAVASQRKGQYDGALAMLRELYRRNPKRPNLDRALGLSTDKLVEQYLAKGDYWSARRLLSNLKAWFPQQTTVVNRESQLKQQAAGLLAEARKRLADGDYREADSLVGRLARVWPEVPAAEEFARALHEKYPRVVVGVSMLSNASRPGAFGDWAARRTGRLVYRTLTEFVGPGAAGGQYACPVGRMEFNELERRLTLRIAPGVGWSSSDAVLSGYDVSRQLLAMACPGDPAYRAEWADVFGSVSVNAVYQVDVELRGAHVRPDALLQTRLVPYTVPAVAAEWPPSNGPYLVGVSSGDGVTYVANPRYFAQGPAQPAEIVERLYARGTDAIRDLRLGRIRVIDWLNPWSLDEVRRDQEIVVQSYRMPLVHCLIPNMRKPLTADRTFRRALVYGIHREAILNHLIGDTELPGCTVVSGPFPSGLSYDDPIGYACDRSIEPRVYEPRLAIALAEVGLQEVVASLKKKGQELKEMPRLVLAHPDNEIARVACSSIQRQLELIGIPLDVRPWQGTAPVQIPEDVDLLYAELAMWEPLADARRLLGTHGMSAGCSAYMSLALRQLDRALDWQQVHDRLRAIHRIAHDDVAVVPLWQLPDYFAYHKSLSGVGSQPVLLYQNIEQWRPAFRYSVAP
ncbi:MAG: hypothetical protein JXB62_00385 [Pirellulales bacterium]|nr:hypothetical protein [Pirellulales bacterium]